MYITNNELKSNSAKTIVVNVAIVLKKRSAFNGAN